MAKHHSKHHDGKHKGREEEKEHERKKGGRVGMWVSGNPDVKEEAEDDETGAETGNRKRGGKVKKHKKRNTGGKVIGLMTGGGVRARLDRPGRKRGGAVGANRSPLSTAHNAGHGAAGSSNPTDTYGGAPD